MDLNSLGFPWVSTHPKAPPGIIVWLLQAYASAAAPAPEVLDAIAEANSVPGPGTLHRSWGQKIIYQWKVWEDMRKYGI